VGLKRIWTRGLSKANKFIMGAAIAYNIKKLLNYKSKKVEVQIMEAKNTLKADLFTLFILPAMVCAYSIKKKSIWKA
jgi:hypothetical protein